MERTPCEHLYDIACRELSEVMAQRDDLLALLKDIELVINPRDMGGISLHEWGSRLRVATAKIQEAIAKADGK
jgi:predicted anti-sigma-YlaC factor YlaD